MQMRTFYTFAILLLLAVAWTSGLWWFVTLIPALPADNPQHTDAIVTLTGGSLRLERGFELLAQGKAQKMFISGVDNTITLPLLLRQKEYRAFAGRLDESRITLGYKAHSTLGNAQETAEWIDREQIHTVRLVTANYHLPRSMYELHMAAPDVIIIPEPVFPLYTDPRPWMQKLENMRLIVSEYCKTILSVIHHSLFPPS